MVHTVLYREGVQGFNSHNSIIPSDPLTRYIPINIDVYINIAPRTRHVRPVICRVFNSAGHVAERYSYYDPYNCSELTHNPLPHFLLLYIHVMRTFSMQQKKSNVLLERMTVGYFFKNLGLNEH